MTMRRKAVSPTVTLIAVAIIALLIGVAVGYFIKPTPPPKECPPCPTQPTQPAQQAPAEGGIKTITITVWAIGPDPPSEYRFKNFEIAADKLNKILEALGANVRVKVEGQFFVRPVEWEEYRKKFYLAFKAGEGPDIYLTGHEDIGYLVENGYIIPLDDYVKKYWDTVYYDVIPTLWDSCKYKGKIYAVPQDTEVRPMYFRKDVLRKLGWTEEQINELPIKVKNGEFTLYDLLEVAKQAVDKGLVERGIIHRVKEGYDYLQFYLAFGGRLWDPAQGKMVATKSAWKKTFEWFYKAVYEYHVISPTQFSGDWDKDFHEPATKGTALFISGGSWHKGEWVSKGLLTEEQFWDVMGFMLHPAGEKGGKPVTLSHPLIYTITTLAEKRGKADIAAALLALVTDPHLNANHAVQSSHLAILYSEISDSRYAKDKFLQDVAYMLDYTHFIPSHPKWALYSHAVYNVLRAVESGDLKPDEAVNELVKELQDKIGADILIED